MSRFISDLRNSWSKNTTGVAGALLTFITGLLTVAGGILLYYDLAASYYGWGKLVETDMNLPNSEILALTVTALPTLVQIAWSMAKVAGHELGEHPGVNVLFWVMLAIDTALDLNQVVTGTPQSWVMSVIVVVIGFGFGSEFLLAFMGSSFIGMVRSAISSPGLWNPNRQDGQRGPMASPRDLHGPGPRDLHRPEWEGARPPTQSRSRSSRSGARRPSSKTRRPSNKDIFGRRK
jgi:hypothetical protein